MKYNKVLTDIILAGKPMIYLYALNVVIDVFTPIYDVFPRLDIPMHIVGGYITAVSIVNFYNIKPYKKKFYIKTNSKIVSALVIISFVSSVAVCWEVYEYFVSALFRTEMQSSVFDTVKDLVLGMFGAYLFSKKEHHSIFLTKK